VTPPDRPSTFFGFTRAEWQLALANRPDESAGLLKLIDDFQAGAFNTSGVLIGIDPDVLIAIAEVSRVFAGRLRAELDAREPNWRQRVAAMKATLPTGNTSESPETQWTHRWVTKWSTLQAFLDDLGGSGASEA
jgi:hypothetical protein